MATIRDVAKHANVSTATVSRVMNRNSYVNEQTQKRVREAIEALNYRPNDVARHLFTGRSDMIALLVPDITNPFFPELARAVEDKANDYGYTFVLCNTDNDIDKQLDYLRTLRQKSVDGLIIVSSSLMAKHLQNIQVPVVALDRTITPSIPSVTVNNRGGAKQAVEHLKMIGCERIAHVTGLEHTDNAAGRLLGYLDSVKQDNWFDSRYVVSGAYQFDQAFEATRTLLINHPEIDGIFAGNDLMGAGILHAAASLAKQIPDDLAVAGFDGIALSETVNPPLTTVAQPIYDMGTSAVEMLVQQIETKDATVPSEAFNVRLVERESTLGKVAKGEREPERLHCGQY